MKRNGSIKLWAVAVWLIIWEIAARLMNKEIFLVSPIKAIIRFSELAITSGFWLSVLGSFIRIAVGFLLAVLVGVILAALSAKYKRVRELFAPIMLAIRAVPIASFIILALICFSSKHLSILISFMIVLPTIYENVFTGIAETDKSLLEMAQVFRLAPSKTRRYIYLPQVYPYFKSACKTAVGMAWKAGVAAEVIGTPKGSIGAMLHQAKIYLETADLLAWTIGIVLLSLLMEKGFLWIVERLDVSLCKLPAPHSAAGAGNAAYACNANGTGNTSDAAGSSLWQKSCDGNSSARMSGGITTAVVISSISKAFGEQKVLDNINFVFPAGKTSAIMAPSGEGKTTLLKIIAGLETADTGNISFEKLFNIGEGEGALIKEKAPKVGVTFQEDRLLEYMTAEENIRLVNEGLSKETVRTAMAAVGLDDESDIKKTVGEYSGGMKRRVSLLRALLAADSAEVILLDEPFKGLDDETKTKTVEFIKEMTQDMTVILVTHDKDEADALGVEKILYL